MNFFNTDLVAQNNPIWMFVKKILVVGGFLFFIYIILGIIFLIFPYSKITDVSLDKDLWGGYEYQKVYVLQEDLFLMDVSYLNLEGKNQEKLAIVPGKSTKTNGGFYESPYSTELYEKDPIDAMRQSDPNYFDSDSVKGIIRKGTKFQTVKLEREYSFNSFTGESEWLTIFVKIIDGEFAQNIAVIDDLSTHYQDEEGGVFMSKPIGSLITPL